MSSSREASGSTVAGSPTTGKSDRRALGNKKTAVAFAPASVGNVGVGFDLLGHAISGAGDTVTVEQVEAPEISVTAIRGIEAEIPLDADRNTAAVAIAAMSEALGLQSGFRIEIDKGIALGSGMGGSAASAVAAVVAVNSMLKIPLKIHELFPYALAGEAVASGSVHGDNVAASLVGGLTLVAPGDQAQVVSLPVPNQLRCVVVRPHLEIQTKAARSVLSDPVPMSVAVAQLHALGTFLAGCNSRNLDLIAAGLKDVLIEPRRAHMIPAFDEVKQAALDSGALGCSISGAGPSVFAWFAGDPEANQAVEQMMQTFATASLSSDGYVSPVNSPGAKLLP